jgi:hypothetical protein
LIQRQPLQTGKSVEPHPFTELATGSRQILLCGSWASIIVACALYMLYGKRCDSERKDLRISSGQKKKNAWSGVGTPVGKLVGCHCKAVQTLCIH